MLYIGTDVPGVKAEGIVYLSIAHAFFQLKTTAALPMDIALVTGRGPDTLTNIDSLVPYVADAHVIHVGQRDLEETLAYGSAQISQTSIIRYDHEAIRTIGIVRHCGAFDESQLLV